MSYSYKHRLINTHTNTDKFVILIQTQTYNTHTNTDKFVIFIQTQTYNTHTNTDLK